MFGMFLQDLWPRPVDFCVCIVIWSDLLPTVSWHFLRRELGSRPIAVSLKQTASPLLDHPACLSCCPQDRPSPAWVPRDPPGCSWAILALFAWLHALLSAASHQPGFSVGFHLSRLHFLAEMLETRLRLQESGGDSTCYWAFEQPAGPQRAEGFPFGAFTVL